MRACRAGLRQHDCCWRVPTRREPIRQIEPEKGVHRPNHVRARGFGRSAARDAISQLIGTGEERVAYAGAFLLIADLLENIRQEVLRLLVLRLHEDQLVQDLLRQLVLAGVEQFAPLGDASPS